MGLDLNGTKFLLYARARGVSFERTATIGRQELLADRAGLEANLAVYGLRSDEGTLDRLISGSAGYAEEFLRHIGAREIVSIDASSYERATVIHDMNEPISAELKNKFSVVLDGGTLEHIFNFPVAIKNCMEMVAEGGHFLAITPTNNHSGHGFYQFSPELFFRVLCKENAFELEHLIAFEETPGSDWYEITDPSELNERVSILNSFPTMLLVIARKVKTVEVFRANPQQSDYTLAWEKGTGNGNKDELKKPSGIGRIPAALLRRLKLKIERRTGVLNSRPTHFKKVRFP